MKRIETSEYHPLYCLAALGAGGLAVTFFVFGWFWIMFGLVGNGIVTPLTPAFFVLLLPLMAVQWKSLETLLKLNRKRLGRQPMACCARV